MTGDTDFAQGYLTGLLDPLTTMLARHVGPRLYYQAIKTNPDPIHL